MLCGECGFDNPKDVNTCSMCGSSLVISANKLNLKKEIKPETEKVSESSYVVYSENAKVTSFPLKTIVVLIIVIAMAAGGFYGYQLFSKEQLKSANAELKASIAQREAEEATRRVTEIRDNALLEKEKIAAELVKQQDDFRLKQELLEKQTAIQSDSTETLVNVKQQLTTSEQMPSNIQAQQKVAPANIEQHVQKMLEGAMSNDESSIQANK